MAFYTHAAAPDAWRGSLVIGLHGYRRQGHRIIAWPFDTSGKPARNFTVLVDGWQATARHPSAPPPTSRPTPAAACGSPKTATAPCW
jgi:glucose/arabinose dehydrogenase